MTVVTGNSALPIDLVETQFSGVTSGSITVLTSTQIGIQGDNGTNYLATGSGITWTTDAEGFVTFTGGTITNLVVDSLVTFSSFSISVFAFLGSITGDISNFLSTYLGGGDSITGTGGDDVLFGYAGNDTINGGGGNDTIFADFGNDTINGGSGTDLLSFVGFTSGVTVDLSLATPQSLGAGLGSDTLISIENVEGTEFGDVFTAGTGTHTIWGFGGNVFFGDSQASGFFAAVN